MMLNHDQQKFLDRRRKLVKTWPYAGGLLLSMILGLTVWLVLTKPLLANPFAVLSQLKDNALPQSTLTLMAAILPVAVLICLLLAFAVILFAFAVFANEKKYLDILDADKDGE